MKIDLFMGINIIAILIGIGACIVSIRQYYDLKKLDSQIKKIKANLVDWKDFMESRSDLTIDEHSELYNAWISHLKSNDFTKITFTEFVLRTMRKK